jgi:tetratricopeptide (TPR) repeat protein
MVSKAKIFINFNKQTEMKKLKLVLIALGLIVMVGNAEVKAAIIKTDKINDLALTEVKDGKYGKDSANCVKNLSLYREFYKQWSASKYKDANLVQQTLNSWRYCFLNCPSVSKNIYIHGDKLINYYINSNKTDSIKRFAYVDTLMMIYDQRIQYFGDDKSVNKEMLIGRKAADLMKYRPNEAKTYYPWFVESFNVLKAESEPTTLFYFYVATIRYVQQGFADKDLILENYVNIEDALEYNLQKYAEDSVNLNKYSSVDNNIEQNISKFATCEKLIELYGPKLDADPDNLALAKNIVKFFEKRRCTKSDVYFKALEKVHAKEPNAESAFSMGKLAFEREQYSKAKPYLEEACNTLPDSLVSKKSSAYLLLAEVYRSLNQYSAARNAALKVLDYNPKEGMVYIIIGDLYVNSAGDCTVQGLRVAYWAAADKYSRAITISDDEKVKDLAQKKLAAIRGNFPEKQDVFMRNLSDGQTITIECWINEQTTVRSR